MCLAKQYDIYYHFSALAKYKRRICENEKNASLNASPYMTDRSI